MIVELSLLNNSQDSSTRQASSLRRVGKSLRNWNPVTTRHILNTSVCQCHKAQQWLRARPESND